MNKYEGKTDWVNLETVINTNMNRIEQGITDVTDELIRYEEEVNILLENIDVAPSIGVVYGQLNGELAPTEIWPETEWEDITESIAYVQDITTIWKRTA
jgi:hypothetical protein